MKNIFTETDYAPVLINSITDPVRVIRADGTVALCNEAMRKTFGDYVGTACYEAIGRGKPCADCMMKRLNGSGEAAVEREINGRVYSLKASPIYDKENSFMGIVEVFRDISEEVGLRKKLMYSNIKMKEDLAVVRMLQRSMFNKSFRKRGEFSFHMGFYPCEEVGGDACDCIPLPDGRMLMYVADVSGHGVRAAMLTVFLRQEIIMLARETGCESLRETIESIRKSYNELKAGENTYITLFLCVLNTRTGELRCVNAGHGVSPLIKKQGKVEEIFLPGAPVCAWSDHAGGGEESYILEKGDRLLLYTDGILSVDKYEPQEKVEKAFSAEPFSSQEFITNMRKLHSLNPLDDLLMFICERE